MPAKKKPEGALECPKCGCRHLILRDKIPIGRKHVKFVRECRHCGTMVANTLKLDKPDADAVTDLV